MYFSNDDANLNPFSIDSKHQSHSPNFNTIETA